MTDDFDPTTTSTPSPTTPPWPVQRHFPITYHDIDVLNHLNHAAYFPFMETLRCDYYLPLLGSTDPKVLDIIIAEAVCRYVRPVSYGHNLIGEVAPALPIGRTSFSLLYRFRESTGSAVTARGKTVVVCFDYEKGVKKEISPGLRTALTRDAVLPATEGWV
ncbi:MAG: acyl-CoA thioesterase [Thermoplasmata archaeon]|nr:acyl-CoA thioesterase [Thermoplasmata archaeon]